MPTYVTAERPLLPPHVERAAREREEERIFREQFRSRLRPVSLDKTPSPSPTQATPLPIIRTSPAIVAPVATHATPTSGAGVRGQQFQGSSPSSHSPFTAAVMARISSPAITPGEAAPDALPEVSPAMSFAFAAAPGGRTISYTMVARYVRALFGMYGLAALIVLLSGALFSFFAPTLVFTGLTLVVSALIVAINEVGQAWRLLNSVVGGLGVLYLALTLLVAPFLLIAFQARASSEYSKA